MNDPKGGQMSPLSCRPSASREQATRVPRTLLLLQAPSLAPAPPLTRAQSVLLRKASPSQL